MLRKPVNWDSVKRLILLKTEDTAVDLVRPQFQKRVTEILASGTRESQSLRVH